VPNVAVAIEHVAVVGAPMTEAVALGSVEGEARGHREISHGAPSAMLYICDSQGKRG
jgi:hypothetical protein